MLEEIQFRSQGIPRLINSICDNLLLTAFAMETRKATLEMLDEVTADMRLDYPSDRDQQQTFHSDSAYPVREPQVSRIRPLSEIPPDKPEGPSGIFPPVPGIFRYPDLLSLKILLTVG